LSSPRTLQSWDKIRVLHVDDDPDQLDFTKLFLEKADLGLQVTSTSSPKKVQQMLQNQPFDCIVSDYKMPAMDGIELASKIREMSNIPFIIYTGRGSEEVAETAFAAGIDDYLRKELDSSHYIVLAKRIRTAVEKHRAEEALRESEEMLRNVFTASPVGVTVTDLHGDIIECNKAMLDMHGYPSKGELIGKSVLTLIAKKDHERAKKNIKKTLEQGSVRNIEYTFLKKDRLEFPVEFYANVIRDMSGSPTNLVVITEDITERNKAEKELEESQKHFQTLFNVTVDPVVIVDGQGTILEVTEKVEEITGFTRDELLGRKFLETNIVTEESKAILMENLEKRLRGIHSPPYEVELLTKGGRKIPHEVNAQGIEYHGTPADMAAFRDITERKHMEDQLLKSERLAAIGELASIVGHELRNPLGVIKNSAYYLRMRLGKTAEKKVMRHLDILEKEVNRSNRIISNLLDLARGPQPPVLQRVDLNQLVNDAVTRIEFPRDVKKELMLGERLEVSADPDMILRVLLNLMMNGVDAIHAGGTLRIQTRAEEGVAEVSVSDTGCGIPEENMEKLFTPLFSTKATGVGLGLHISKGLVEEHGGSITVQSKVGEGSTFTVRLPTYESEGR
jgi:PAS domain S-box-containing protein